MQEIIDNIQKKIIKSTQIPEDINCGEIYMATCKTSNKSYIGQAKCYTKSEGNFKIWGSKKRWRSHIYESRSEYDHSKILNSAIRKYGENDFELKTLIKCNLNELDHWETEYIKIYNTIIPNGYNIMNGGSHRTVSPEAKIKIKNYRKGKKHSDLTKLYMSIGHFDHRKGEGLNKLIKPQSKSAKKYIIEYPIIKDNKLHFISSFSNSYETALEKINQLELEHKSLEKITKIKENRILGNTKKKDKIVLPEFITAIYNDIYKIGYEVSNYKFCDGTTVPSKQFISANTNTRNLHNASVYLKSLKNIDSNLSFKIPDLPIGFTFSKRVSRGNKIDLFQVKTDWTENNIKYKNFQDMTLSIEEKYNMAKKYYDSLEIYKN